MRITTECAGPFNACAGQNSEKLPPGLGTALDLTAQAAGFMFASEVGAGSYYVSGAGRAR